MAEPAHNLAADPVAQGGVNDGYEDEHCRNDERHDFHHRFHLVLHGSGLFQADGHLDHHVHGPFHA